MRNEYHEKWATSVERVPNNVPVGADEASLSSGPQAWVYRRVYDFYHRPETPSEK